MDPQMNKFCRLVKVDEQTHEVWGLATSEVPDKDNEIADYAESKKAFKTWSDDFLGKTQAAGQEPSLGNIRLMHQTEIAGKVIKIEYKDDQRQIWIGTQPANDEIWKLIKGGFVTGYSIGGSYLWKRKEGGNTRFAPRIAEVSYVDNPCNPEAAFAYIKADGSVEMRKFTPGKREPFTLDEVARRAVELMKTSDMFLAHTCEFCPDELDKDGKTKRKGGKDLHASDFAWVGDSNDPNTWKLPIHDAAHVRNALARFNQAGGIPADEKAKVKAKIVARARSLGIEVGEKAVRVGLEKLGITASPRAVTKVQHAILSKSLWDVGELANVLQSLYWVFLRTDMEREVEQDDSDIPDEIRAAVTSLASTLVDLAEEETEELTAALSGGKSGDLIMSTQNTDLQKAEMEKRKSLHGMLDQLHKMHSDHCADMTAHAEKVCKMHKDMMLAAHSHIDKLKKSIGDMTEDEKGEKGKGKDDEADKVAKGAKEAADKIEADRLAKEASDKIEADRLAKEAADKAELAKVADTEHQTILATLQKTIDDLKAAQAAELKKSADQLAALTAEVEKLKKEPEPTTVKQTLVGKDEKVINKAASGGDVMKNTGLAI